MVARAKLVERDNGLCMSPTASRLNKMLQNPPKRMKMQLYEERKSEWLSMALLEFNYKV